MSQLVAVSLLGYNQQGQESWKGVAALLVEQLLRLGIRQEPHLSIFGHSWKLEEGDGGSNSVSGLNSVLGLPSQRGTFFVLCHAQYILSKEEKPKAVYDHVVSPNGFAVRPSCLEQGVTAFAAPVRGWGSGRGEDTVLKGGRRNRASRLSRGEMASPGTRLALVQQKEKVKEPSLLPQCWILFRGVR